LIYSLSAQVLPDLSLLNYSPKVVQMSLYLMGDHRASRRRAVEGLLAKL
jgi:hypothetical protein